MDRWDGYPATEHVWDGPLACPKWDAPEFFVRQPGGAVPMAKAEFWGKPNPLIEGVHVRCPDAYGMGAFHWGTIAQGSGKPRGDGAYQMGPLAKVKCSRWYFLG